MSQERFHDLGTRWLHLRMQFHRWTGLQPGEEPVAARLERIRAARLRRRLARAR